jgi:hypothetical protein
MAHFKIDAESYRPVEVHGAGAVENGGSQVLGTQPNLVAHFPPRIDLQIADTVPVAIDPAALHFFDEDTGAALT